MNRAGRNAAIWAAFMPSFILRWVGVTLLLAFIFLASIERYYDPATNTDGHRMTSLSWLLLAAFVAILVGGFVHCWRKVTLYNNLGTPPNEASHVLTAATSGRLGGIASPSAVTHSPVPQTLLHNSGPHRFCTNCCQPTAATDQFCTGCGSPLRADLHKASL